MSAKHFNADLHHSTISLFCHTVQESCTTHPIFLLKGGVLIFHWRELPKIAKREGEREGEKEEIKFGYLGPGGNSPPP